MFEHDYSKAIFQGAAIRNSAIANQNAEAADEWEAYAKKLKAERDQLQVDLLASEANSAGLKAQLIAVKAAAPNCAALADSGQRFQDGRTKTVSRLAYEKAFDNFLTEKGVADPSTWRQV